MSEDRGLPTDIEVGDDAYALRTFAVKDGRLTSVAQKGSYWEDGVCEAVCLSHPNDPDHEVPTANCCGIYAYWTVGDLVHEDGRYAKFARDIVAVVRLEGMTIEGDNGVQAKRAQIVAWWCAEDAAPRLARACAARTCLPYGGSR